MTVVSGRWQVRVGWRHQEPDLRYAKEVEAALLAHGATGVALALGQVADTVAGADELWVTLSVDAGSEREAGELARAAFERAVGESAHAVEVLSPDG